MKILLTGGGTGGHFYPVIAVAQALNKLAHEQKLIDLELYYMAPQPYDKTALYENNITFVRVPAGKVRRYFSIQNFLDIFVTGWGICVALVKMFNIYPDVVFGKGGYVSFPALFAARLLRIPVIIHESDSAPGKANVWAAKFAKRIAVSYPSAAEYFGKAKDRVAHTGNPVREELMHPVANGAHEFLHLETDIPVLLILGGSQGSQIINQNIVDALPRLVEKYQIIHQAGPANLKTVEAMASVVLLNNTHKDRYKPFDHLNSLALRMAAGVADVVISRAGSTIFEIAQWGIPAILIPITDSNGDHQRKNAYSYARNGAALVIEENNLTPNILASEVDRLMGDANVRGTMKKAAQGFAKSGAARLIAQEILAIAIQHEK